MQFYCAGVRDARSATVLGSLCRDTRGNVLILTAAALIPMMAMVGSAIDLGRAYMARTRMQQACDAGALAARRLMGNVNTLSAAERETAERYFDFNFPVGIYNITDRVRTYTRGEPGVVLGTVSIAVPTTIMRVFGYETIPLTTTCESTLVVPNTDVMFVLDVTGSMLETPDGDTVTKIDGLKQAVKEFYKALGPGTSSGGGRIRYGFVPYSNNVNVGAAVYAVNPSYIVGGAGPEEWEYQSREAQTKPGTPVPTYGAEGTAENGGSSDSSVSYTTNWANSAAVGSYPASFSGLTSAQCAARPVPGRQTLSSGSASASTAAGSTPTVYPAPSRTNSYTSTQTKTVRDYQYASSGFIFTTCRLQSRDGTITTTSTTTKLQPISWTVPQEWAAWIYKQRSFDVSPVVRDGVGKGVMANPAYWTGPASSDPNDGAPATLTWNGCIEEAQTVKTIVASSSIEAPDDAYDLKIDLIPNSKDTRWKPFLREVQYNRSVFPGITYGEWMGRPDWVSRGFAGCPAAASPLKQYIDDYVSASQSSVKFNQYVDGLTPIGGTYHDIGLIWGARFLSPTGIFAATNSDATGPGGYPIARHIVFMTDGRLDTRSFANDPWGVTKMDERIAPMLLATDSRNNESHSRRVDIICNAMKGKGFTVWVVGFGIPTVAGQPALPTQLANCATDADHASTSSNAADLRSRFQAIAQTIGGLRLSQ